MYEATPGQVPSSALSLSGGLNSRLVAALAAYEGGQKIYNQAKEMWRMHFGYSVSVSERDPMFADVYDWLLSIMPDERHRSLSVETLRSRSYDDSVSPSDGSSENDAPPPLVVRFDDTASRQVVIDGHRIRVKKTNPEVSATATLSSLNMREPPESKINFFASSYSGQQAVLAQLHRINDERKKTRKAVLRMVNQWGSWRTRSDLPPRTLASVALPEEQKTRIVEDLGRFLEAEDQYNRLAIPWHRSYMFCGPPGTGKTSLIKALCNHYNLDLWYISLADLKTESSLLGLLAEVGPRSGLLLEDIDSIKIAQEGDVSDPGVISISSLLNTLDGVATPHGLITFMSTNFFDRIDERLTREGRMDLIETLDYPSKNTIADLFKQFYGYYPSWVTGIDPDPIQGLATSKVAEIFKKNMNDMMVADKLSYELICEYEDRNSRIA